VDFIDQLRTLASRVPTQLEHTKTEEATKHALILPFINALGYNVFDPAEVMPEFTCDVGTKKGEKIDYAILQDGKPIILFECKQSGTNLDFAEFSQLLRYFHVTSARIGVLTNGVVYKFYTDLEEQNKMDSKPFLEFNLLDFKEPAAEEIKRFTKASFNLDELLSAAVELKYTKEIKRILGEQLHAPSDEFVKFFTAQVYTGVKTQKVLQQFTDITKRALGQFINERIADRLKSAMEVEGQNQVQVEVTSTVPTPAVPSASSKIETTEEEIEAYHIVKAILRETVTPTRVAIRDAESYCAILLDDNNRKPICRFRFGANKKSIGLFDEQKNEERVAIQDLNDIFGLAERLKQTARNYDAKTSQPSEATV